MEENEPPTESQYATLDGFTDRNRDSRKAVGRRRLNISAEKANCVNRYLEFPSSHTDCNEDEDVDPSLASVVPFGGSQSGGLEGGNPGFKVPTTPLQQKGGMWKDQAHEWTSRTQAFFDELDQRPLHEVVQPRL
jgi:hypothetical protein